MINTVGELADPNESVIYSDLSIGDTERERLPESHKCQSCSYIGTSMSGKIIALLRDESEIIGNFCAYKQNHVHEYPVKVFTHIEDARLPQFSCPIEEQFPRDLRRRFGGCMSD